MLVRASLLLLALLAGFFLWFYFQDNPKPQPAQAKGVLPTFDTVRIDKEKTAVLAGRSAPFALVSLMHDDKMLGNKLLGNKLLGNKLLDNKLLGSAHASARGEWVMVIDKPLTLNALSYLRLRSKNRAGEVVLSDEIVTLSASHLPYVVLTNPNGSEVLQSGFSELGDVLLETIDYDENKNAIFSGRARAQAQVFLYYNNQFIGQARAGQNDKWQIKAKDIATGKGVVRLDLLGEKGEILARLELPVAIEVAQKIEPQVEHKVKPQVLIQAGDSLWKIARNLYGKGTLYTIIYEYNKDNIKNPNLIYPGQVFQTPNQ